MLIQEQERRHSLCEQTTALARVAHVNGRCTARAALVVESETRKEKERERGRESCFRNQTANHRGEVGVQDATSVQQSIFSMHTDGPCYHMRTAMMTPCMHVYMSTVVACLATSSCHPFPLSSLPCHPWHRPFHPCSCRPLRHPSSLP
jgi:hypothetical protein